MLGVVKENPTPSAILEQTCERRLTPFLRHLTTPAPGSARRANPCSDFVLSDLDLLRQSPRMVAPKSAVLSTHLPTRGHGQSPKVLRRQMLSRALDSALGPA